MEKTDVYKPLGPQRKPFLKWQMRTILITMIGYAIFYFVRKNFSLAMPGLTAEYGITNKSFGWIIFIGSLVYGFSRFINGYLVDKIKGRIVMALGLFLCAVANFAFGFGVNLSAMITGTDHGADFTSTFIFIMGIIIILNQYFQGMGYPPCARILPHWIHPSELATKMSIWNAGCADLRIHHGHNGRQPEQQSGLGGPVDDPSHRQWGHGCRKSGLGLRISYRSMALVLLDSGLHRVGRFAFHSDRTPR